MDAMQRMELTGLSVNPKKIDLIVFTRKYRLQPFKAPTLAGKALEVENLTRYLGVVLDKRLTWNEHVLTDRFPSAFWTCQRAFSSK